MRTLISWIIEHTSQILVRTSDFILVLLIFMVICKQYYHLLPFYAADLVMGF